MTLRQAHEVTYKDYPGSHGDRPEPWQRCYSCLCGADLGFDEEGGTYADVEAALEAHLREEGLIEEDTEEEEEDG